MNITEFLELNWLFGRNQQLSMDEILIKKIIQKLLNKETDVEKLHSPVSDEYFLIDRKNQVYVCISETEVKISNHDFHYNKNLNFSLTEKFKELVRNQIEQERKVLKKELFKNEVDLLHKINEL